ncbi:MAG: biopolymer transporter ExbD [Saprospiraceae bacterium]|nr:biopolymer transporter ExbD [Saprospiraceae bacterium]MBK8670020.1 biopolymer transporter ExbD [Saprospiraceae bacterium]MBL0100404.1 biopolymer transporter ExbD [Saprospiraceae bacterium]
MAVKKRSKVSAEFNMSSLTDIIFLLLIFFMLTSNTVQISIPLPESNSTTVAPTNLPVMMTIDGAIKVVGKPSSLDNLERDIASAVRTTENKENATITIISEVGVPWESVHKAMAVASGLKLKAIIATQPTK